MAEWNPSELLVFLQHLARVQSLEDCAWLDRKLTLTGRGNYEVLVEWLCIAAASEYEPAYPRIREVLTRVGRMKYLRPLYVALGQNRATRELARAVFEQAAAGYHILARRVIQAVLATYP